MSFASIGRALVRRWYVSVLGILITVGLLAGAVVEVPATYQARASVLLLPPKTKLEANPLLGLGGLQEVSDVLARAISDSETADQILAIGSGGKYSVGRDTSTSGPIILITAEASTSTAALAIKRALIDKLGPILTGLQVSQNVPTDSLITLVTLTDDKTVSTQRKSQLRALIAAAAVGILLTILLVALVENRSTRRKRKLADRAAADAQLDEPEGHPGHVPADADDGAGEDDLAGSNDLPGRDEGGADHPAGNYEDDPAEPEHRIPAGSDRPVPDQALAAPGSQGAAADQAHSRTADLATSRSAEPAGGRAGAPVAGRRRNAAGRRRTRARTNG